MPSGCSADVENLRQGGCHLLVLGILQHQSWWCGRANIKRKDGKPTNAMMSFFKLARDRIGYPACFAVRLDLMGTFYKWEHNRCGQGSAGVLASRSPSVRVYRAM